MHRSPQDTAQRAEETLCHCTSWHYMISARYIVTARWYGKRLQQRYCGSNQSSQLNVLPLLNRSGLVLAAQYPINRTESVLAVLQSILDIVLLIQEMHLPRTRSPTRPHHHLSHPAVPSRPIPRLMSSILCLISSHAVNAQSMHMSCTGAHAL